MSPRAGLALIALVAVGCGELELPPFGQLRAPSSIAVQQRAGRAFIASAGADELRVFDLEVGQFLTAPAVLFPLAIPTVSRPTALAAGDRFVFVLSGSQDELGFVDTRVPSGAAGPRAVTDAGGFPSTQPLGFVATALHPVQVGSAREDRALVAGLGEGNEGHLVIVAPPAEASSPSIVAALELADVSPTALALEPASPSTLVGAAGTTEDCRALAIADAAQRSGGPPPGIVLSSLRIFASGAVAFTPIVPASRIPVRVQVELFDGTLETRAASVLRVAFAPAPYTPGQPVARAADPCALRPGRLFALLDPSYCAGAVVCPDLIAIDLPSGQLAIDPRTGGPAAFDLPGAGLDVLALQGPLSVHGGFAPVSRVAPLTSSIEGLASLVLTTLTTGNISYLAGGLGTYLVGPGVDDRASADPAFLIDAQAGGPGLSAATLRTDTQRRTAQEVVPEIRFPPEAQPRDEDFTASFDAPLPGLAALGPARSIDQDGVFRLSDADGRNFLFPTPIVAASGPRDADRLVPQLAAKDVTCEGFPVRTISADGRSLTVDRTTLENPEACLSGDLPLALQPPLDRPWVVTGSRTGTIGRLMQGQGGPSAASRLFARRRLLLEFVPPVPTDEDALTPGASYRFSTTDGFTPFGAQPGEVGTLPTSLAAYRIERVGASPLPAYRVLVSYRGSQSLLVFDPERPSSQEQSIFQ